MTPPDSLLSVRNLSVAFNDHNPKVVDDISFDIAPGQTLALVGESGSGKSVSANSILRLLPKTADSLTTGEINFMGRDLRQVSETELRMVRGNDISMIFQEPMTALNPLHTIGKQISESLTLHQKISKDDAGKIVVEWLNKVGINDPERRANSLPHELSGGQRQRAMIAMALVNKPKLLIADEPTTALDVTVQKQILELLEQLKTELNMSVLLISHDLSVVKNYSQHIAVMHEGKIVEYQTTANLFAKPEDEYTKELLAAEPSGNPVIVDTEKVHLKASNLHVTYPIRKNFWGKTLESLNAVHNISLNVRKGTTLGIIGESGSGKSTLAMAILQLQKYQGEIWLGGEALHQSSRKQLRALREQFQIVFQDPFGSLSPRMTVAQIIAEGLKVHQNLSDLEIDEEVVQVMREVELDPAIRHRYPHEFSGGQRQRIAIARAVILKPELIILDEPTSALDRSIQGQVLELLKRLQQRYGITYLFITHDLKIVKTIAHTVIVMHQGKVIERGQTKKVLSTPESAYTQRLVDAAFFLNN